MLNGKGSKHTSNPSKSIESYINSLDSITKMHVFRKRELTMISFLVLSSWPGRVLSRHSSADFGGDTAAPLLMRINRGVAVDQPAGGTSRCAVAACPAQRS